MTEFMEQDGDDPLERIDADKFVSELLKNNKWIFGEYQGVFASTPAIEFDEFVFQGLPEKFDFGIEVSPFGTQDSEDSIDFDSGLVVYDSQDEDGSRPVLEVDTDAEDETFGGYPSEEYYVAAITDELLGEILREIFPEVTDFALELDELTDGVMRELAGIVRYCVNEELDAG